MLSTPWIRVRDDQIRRADGSRSSFTVVSRSNFVLVVCELPDRRLVMTEQYRYAAGRWSLELPQGGREPGESAEDAALRELREETGWIGDQPRVLADRLYEAGDWATQHFAVVRVHPVRQETRRLEPGEWGLRVRHLRRAELASYVRSGRLCDAATLAALALRFGAVSGGRSSEGEWQ